MLEVHTMPAKTKRAQGGETIRWGGEGPFLDAGALGAVMAKAFAKEPAASLLLVDLDNFHQVNVQAGRETGDKVIRAAMAVMKKWAETDWRVGRIGGDEFALFASGMPLEAAFLKADKLRQELDAAMAKELAKGITCTASVGVAAAPRDAKSSSDLMKSAGDALWAAKDQGGDAVALAPGADMVLKSSYYPASQLGRLKSLAERQKKKESVLLREALDDLLRKYDRA
jgi:diguanylate cyclase (GGDEF)-like protein